MSHSHLPVKNRLVLTISHSLDLSPWDHSMFWVACTLAYIGFFLSSKLTVPLLARFSKELHLGVADIAVDSSASPSCLPVRIMASKTDPSRQGCFIHIDQGK